MDSTNPDPKNIPDDDLVLQNYQDELDTNDSIKDPAMDERPTDPTKILGVDPKEFKRELDQYAFDDGMKREDQYGDSVDETNEDAENHREVIESLDMDEGDATKY